ncbi:MAG: hypothetical protein ACK5P5_05790 [Pseudobdellovibrionaceae bacterium]
MQIMILFIAAFILVSQHFALASEENPEINSKCAHADLKDTLSKSTKLQDLPANWKIQQELKEDFHSDRKTDVAAVLNRSFALKKYKTAIGSQAETKEKPKEPVFLSQFGNCDFSIETVY